MGAGHSESSRGLLGKLIVNLLRYLKNDDVDFQVLIES